MANKSAEARAAIAARRRRARATPGCKARRYNDQLMCDTCALQWDVKDTEPPACVTAHDRHVTAMRELWQNNV